MSLQEDINEVAWRIVRLKIAQFAVQDDLCPCKTTSLSQLDTEWLTDSQIQLEELGFSSLGDFQPPIRNRLLEGTQLVRRLMLDSDRNILVSITQLQLSGDVRQKAFERGDSLSARKAIEMYSGWSDGSFLVSFNSASNIPSRGPAEISETPIRGNSSVALVLAAHRAGLAMIPQEMRSKNRDLEGISNINTFVRDYQTAWWNFYREHEFWTLSELKKVFPTVAGSIVRMLHADIEVIRNTIFRV